MVKIFFLVPNKYVTVVISFCTTNLIEDIVIVYLVHIKFSFSSSGHFYSYVDEVSHKMMMKIIKVLR